MTLFERSTAAFASYAAFFAPHLPADELSALQVRLWRWQVELFGSSDDRELVLLTVEGCRHLNRVIDDSAVSRVLVCLAQLCTSNRLDFGVIMKSSRDQYVPSVDILTALGNLSQIILRSPLCVQSHERSLFREAVCARIVDLYLSLRALTSYNDEFVENIYRSTAEQLMQLLRKGS